MSSCKLFFYKFTDRDDEEEQFNSFVPLNEVSSICTSFFSSSLGHANSIHCFSLPAHICPHSAVIFDMARWLCPVSRLS